MKQVIYITEAKVSVEMQEAIENLRWVEEVEVDLEALPFVSEENIDDIIYVINWVRCLLDGGNECF